jgi:large subunit ribosomal protein L22
MEVQSKLRYVRISPRKARKAVDLIRGRGVEEALNLLMLSPQKSARIVKKVLDSAIANANANYSMDVDNLFVKRAFVDEGATLKRFMPRAMGRATQILKRTSHITIVLDEKSS